MNFIKANWFNLLAALLLFFALGQHPYSYFQILRVLVTVCAAYNAYACFNSSAKGWAWVFVVIAILFNPIAPIYLSRDTWAPLDVIAGIIFMVFAFNKSGK